MGGAFFYILYNPTLAKGERHQQHETYRNLIPDEIELLSEQAHLPLATNRAIDRNK